MPRLEDVQPQEEMVLCRDLSIAAGAKPIVLEATIAVTPGTITVLAGASGAGKTVLAEAVFGLRGPDDDGVRVVGGEVGCAAEVGVLVFQQDQGIGHLSVLENLSLVRDDRARNRELLARLGLDPEELARNLSVGQARRLAVGQGIVAGRRLLWVDEPAAGLDLRRADRLAAILSEEAERGAAVVVTSHQPELMLRLSADRLLFLRRDGRLVGPRSLAAEGSAELAAELRRLLAEDAERPRALKVSHRRGRRQWLAEALETVYGAARESWSGVKSMAWVSQSAHGWDARAMLREALRLAAKEGATFYLLVGSIFALVFVLILKIAVEPLFLATTVLVDYGPVLVTRFSPAMAGILVAARAGAAISAWIGQLTYRRQFDALRLLRNDLEERLVGPAWLGLAAGGLTGTLLFAVSLTSVFCVYLGFDAGASAAWELLRNFDVERGIWALGKTLLYAAVISAVTLTRARCRKDRVEDVASHLTRGIVISTVLVMALEALMLSVEWRRETL